MQKGTIESITPRMDNELLVGYDVVLLVEYGIPITANVRCEASEAGINGEAVLELRGLGGAQKTLDGRENATPQPLLAAGSEIAAAAPPQFRGFFGAPMSKSVRELLAIWSPDQPTPDSLSNRLRALSDDVPTRMSRTKQEVNALSERISPDFKLWKVDFAAARDQAVAAFEKLGSTEAPADAAALGAPATDQVMPLIRAARTEADNLPRVDRHRLQNAADTLDRAVKAIKELGDQTGTLRSTFTSADHSFGRGSADFSLASQELDASAKEVLAQPWLLLGGDEDSAGAGRTDAENREIVRQYAIAAVEHQFAMKGIEDALRRDSELLNTVPGLADLLRTRLNSATALFEAETARMENLLLGPPPSKKPAK